VVGGLLLRGLLAGIVAAVLAFGFAKVFAEPHINTAIEFEKAHDEAERKQQIENGITPAPEEPELFSRTLQGGVGLLTGVVGLGAGIGAIFGVMFAFANGRLTSPGLGKLGPGATATLLSLYGLWSVYLIPALKYPPNPPAVGEPDTIALRTGLYFLMMAISIASTVGALTLRSSLIPKFGAWTGAAIAFIVYVVVIAVFFGVLPEINEVPENFPATTLWQFRIASLGTQSLLWGGMGLVFGWLVERPKGAFAHLGAPVTTSR
jgi:predicted cobalt transporter CbtA